MKKLMFPLVLSLVISSCSEREIAPQSELFKISVAPLENQVSNGRTDAIIVNPQGAGSYTEGNTIRIEWAILTCGCDWSAPLNIYLFKGNTQVLTIASNIPFYPPSYYDWTIPYLTSWGSDFRVKIEAATNASDYSFSNFFTINVDKNTLATAPIYLETVYDYWSNPYQANIWWHETLRTNNYELQYSLNSSNSWIPLANTSSTGYNLYNLQLGNSYSVRIRSCNNRGCSAWFYGFGWGTGFFYAGPSSTGD